MDTVKLSKTNTKIIAHRGLSGLESENTSAAFVAAGNRSYFGIETDVHQTIDGKFVVIHDDTTGRVSKINLTVENATLLELQSIKLNDVLKNDSAERNDLIIPTLEDYISICKKYNKIAVIEIKNNMDKEKIGDLLAIVDNYNYLQKSIFISFSWDNLVRIREILPKQTVQFLTSKYEENLIVKLAENGFDLDIYYKELNKEIVESLHQNNIRVNCWTCDNLDDAENLISYGVDYITTNILE